MDSCYPPIGTDKTKGQCTSMQKKKITILVTSPRSLNTHIRSSVLNLVSNTNLASDRGSGCTEG